MSSTPLRSFEKFSYSIRPSKQVERKLIIQFCHRLSAAGYPIHDYTYLGFGSVYYVDFVLFHRYLYIDRMICVEQEAIPKRMRFNSPFGFVRLQMKSATDVISGLSRQKRYMVWLDYDYAIDPSVLSDLDALVKLLAPGSILMVTVDARARLPEAYDSETLSEVDRQAQTLDYFRDRFEHLLDEKIELTDVTGKSHHRLIGRILRSQLSTSTKLRPDGEFLQTLQLLYADNAPMLTIGGVVVAGGAERSKIRTALIGLDFVSYASKVVEISVPPLTERERLFLNSRIGSSTKSKKPPFEITPSMAKAYRRYSRHYPSYVESVM